MDITNAPEGSVTGLGVGSAKCAWLSGKSFRKSLLYLLLTFASSWTLAFMYFGMDGKLGTPSFLAVAVVFMFTPMLSAMIVQKVFYREKICSSLGVSWRFNPWFLVGWLLPSLMALLTVAIDCLLPGVSFCLDPAQSNATRFLSGPSAHNVLRHLSYLPIHPFWLLLFGGLVAGATINAVAGFGEELGWRGLLQKELAALGFWKSSWIIGIIWGIWHLPLIIQGFNYPGYPKAGIFMMCLCTVLLAPLMAYIRIKSRSVLAVAIMHGTLNATAGLPLLLIRGGDSLTTGMLGAGMMITLAILNFGLFCLAGTRPFKNEGLQV